MRRPTLLPIALLLGLTLAWPATAAEVYRWVDPQGQVHYSDQPPPSNIKKTQRIKAPASANVAPSEDSGRVKAAVILYSAACGATCEQAAEYLSKRGVDFTLKAVDKDRAAADELKKRTGDMGVPVLIVGESMQRGYSPSVWDKMLEMGGYPTPAKPAPVKEEDKDAPKENEPAPGQPKY